jgi:hypothetical protein
MEYWVVIIGKNPYGTNDKVFRQDFGTTTYI